jgi:CRISPR-associated protein Csc2
VAPERRRGREFLRANDLLYPAPKTEKLCSLNTNAPCEKCIDCFLYGFAAGGEGAQKSRVWTEDAFSILPSTELISDRTINAVYETGTMRDEEGNVSTALNTSEYIKPGVHFLDILTLKDVTADELRYAVGNVLLTSRYGAVSSRVGRMENQILGVFGGIAELPSSLELVQGVYDQLQADKNTELEHPLPSEPLIRATQTVIADWTDKRGISMQLSQQELDELLADVDRHWSLPEQESFLKRLDASYQDFRPNPDTSNNKSGKKKGKSQTSKQ